MIPRWREFFKEGEVRHADFSINARRVERERKEGEAERKTYEVAISSEVELERWFGIEILGHGKDEVDMTRLDRGAAVLIDHRGDQVGVVEPKTANVAEDRILRADVRFSSSARGQEVEQDVIDEIRQGVSVGYIVRAAKLVETRRTGKGEAAVSIDVWRVTDWQPMEVSLVSVPADVSVGVGRSEAGPEAPGSGKGAKPTEGPMKKVRNEKGEVVEVNDDDPRPAVSGRATITASERDKQITEILDLCDGHGVSMKEARAWVDEGLSADQVSARILESKRTKPLPQPSEETLEGLAKKDRKRYSYSRAILGAAAQREGSGRFDGVEAEVSQEIDRRMDGSIKRHGGIFIPIDLRSEEDRQRQNEYRRSLQTRALDSKVAGKGTETIFDEPGELIEILRQNSVAIQLGARMLTGLTAPVAFPKHTGRLTAFWVGENPGTDVADTDLGFGIVNLVPKTIQASTAYSRQFLVQASIDGEAMVRSELGAEHALLLDRSSFHGEGAAGEPTGVYKAPDVNARAVGGIPDFIDVVDTIGLVADDNALAGNLGWVTTPLLASVLLRTLVASAAGSDMIWTGPLENGRVAGYRSIASNQISKTMTGSEDTGGAEHGAIFGNWTELLIGMFLGLEIIVDPFAKKKRGLIEVTSFQMADLVLRHGESFAKWTGATIV